MSHSRKEKQPKLFNHWLNIAIEEKATDIHLDSQSKGYRLAIRVDGKIHKKETLSFENGQKLLNQIRISASLGTEALPNPKEGRMSWSAEGVRRDVRVTVMPTPYGDAGHLRLLTPPEEILEVSHLGLTEEDMSDVKSNLEKPEGLILIAGPTGAGKTMTLYSLASMLNLDHAIAVSIEDPVEFEQPDIRQVQVDEEQGLTFPKGLRSLLRMDPDIILIGEIRDHDSALTAVHAASSGRFVLATLHARDVASAIESFRFLSVPDHFVASTLRMVLAQNLVRRVCRHCKKTRATNASEKALFKAAGLKAPPKVPEASGCARCHHYGYMGRVGVFETLTISPDMREDIANGRGASEFRKKLTSEKHPSLMKNALLKVAEGVTTLEEIQQIHWPGASEEAED